MKAVCFIVQNAYEIDIRVRRKAEALVAAGYSVDAIALRSPKSKEREFTLNGVKVYTVSLGKMRGSLARYAFEYIAFFILALIKVSALMRRRHYVAVDINTLPDFLVFAGCYTRWKGAKLMLDMHEITPEFFMSKYGVGHKHWLVRLSGWLERLSLRYADYVLTINEPIECLLQARGLDRGKSTVIMNAADDVMFSTKMDSPEERNAFVMMYHGTLTGIYGLDIALEALARVQKRMPNAEFWILGDGPERKQLEDLASRLGIASKVTFIGRVLPQEIPSWLNRCDIGVLATRSDVFLDYSFSNKLSEYIIMGKAVISSRLKTIRHYFSEEALAFFTPNNPADLADQMVRLYSDHELRADLARKAKKEYAPISWAVMKERYLKAVADLVGPASEASSASALRNEVPACIAN